MKKTAIIILVLLFAGTASSVQMHSRLDPRVDPEDSPTFVDLILSGGNIMSAASINLKPSDDNDDYFQFTTESNIPTIAAVGGDVIRLNDSLDIVPAGGVLKFRNNSQVLSFAASPSMSSSDNYIWPATDAATDRQPLVSNASAVLRFGDIYYSQTELSSTDTSTSGSTLIGMASLNGPTYTTLRNDFTIFRSSGMFHGGTISDLGGGNIKILAGNGAIRPSDDHRAELCFFDWPEISSVTTTVDAINYIGVEYNSGTPQAVVRLVDTWNLHDEFPLGSVVNEGGTLHVVNKPHFVANAIGHTLNRFHETDPIARDEHNGGLILGESGDNNQNVTMTAGALWDRLTRFAFGAIDTSGADTFDTYLGTTPSQTGISQWETSYDNNPNQGGTKTALGIKKFGTLWFYLELDGGLVMIYGTSNAAVQAQASNEGVPAVVPGRVTDHGVLLGRYIIKEGETVPIAIETVFTTAFATTGVTSHLNITDIGSNTHPQIDTFIANNVIGTNTQAWDADLDTLATMQTGAPGALQLLTQSELEILDDATITTTEINYLEGVTLGTVVASKVLAVGSNFELDMGFGDRINVGEIDGSVKKSVITDLNAKEAYWRFEDDNFDIDIDDSASTHDLQLDSGTAGYCNRGKGIGLDPLPGLAEYSVDDAWKGVTETAARSLSFWIRTTNTTTTSFITSWGDVGGAGQNWQVGWVGSTLKIGIFTGAGNKQSDALTIADGLWHHVAITMAANADMDEIIIYIDGSVSTGTGSEVAVNTGAVDDVEVGHGAGGGNFDGCIDELAIFSDVLSQGEIDNIVAGQETQFIGGSDDASIDWTKAHTPLFTSKDGTFGEAVNIGGAFNHDGSTVGFYGIAPAIRPEADDLDSLLTALDLVGIIEDTR